MQPCISSFSRAPRRVFAGPLLKRAAPAFKALQSTKQSTFSWRKVISWHGQLSSIIAQAGAGQQGGEGRPPTEAESGAGEEAGWPKLPSGEELFEELQQRLKAAGLPGLGEDVERAAAEEADVTLDAALEALSMGSWRLKELVCPQIEALAAQIENVWRDVLPDLSLYPLPKEFRYMDSLDPEGKVPFSYQVLKGSEKGEEGWPRLQVENRCYQSRAFRKLHLEVAVRQDGLQVLHCVMYPRLEFDLPILSLDVVANDGRVSLAIIDPCPVRKNLALPPLYLKPVRDLQRQFDLQNNRTVPDWGKAIFSSECIIMRPTEARQIAEFLKYAISLSKLHVELGRLANPVSTQRVPRLRELHAAHRRYCDKQLENDKTRAVLAKSFGAEKAEVYMRTVMFNYEELPADIAAAT